jgi:hypothetical protein
MTFNRSRINVSLSLLEVPFLITSFPDLSLAAAFTNERLVDIELWEKTVSIDMRELVWV